MSYRVTVHPGPRSFTVGEGQTILDGATAAGLDLPWGCGVGACRTCCARLRSGHVSMPPGTALDRTHLEARLVLPCVAVPRSDLELDVGDRVGLLTPLPWTD